MRAQRKYPDNHQCPVCGELKDVKEDYYWVRRNPHRPYPSLSKCKPCWNENERWRTLYKKYKITKEEWNQLYDEQRGRCAVCGKAFDGLINVDHDHVTGQVRGLLCSPCNWLLGSAYDDTEILAKAIEYLARQY